MVNSYIGNDDWGEENNYSPSTVEQTKTSAQRGSWEDEKVLEGENKLEQLRRNLVDIQDLQDSFKKSASDLNETTKETKLMTRDMLEAVPHVRKIGENLMALTKVVKDDFTNVPLSVSQKSYDAVEGRINAIIDTAVDRCADRIKGIINEGISEGMQNADRVEKHLEEIFEKFTEKMSANTQARLDLLQKKIDKKEEQIKLLEQKGGGKFLTNGQLTFLVAGYAFFLGAGVWGLSTAIKHESAPGWVVVLLFVGLASNFIFYAIKFAWKGIKWLWRHVPGNNS